MAAPPARIGPYAITGVLGQGGMGVVYRGRHVELGVERAVKVMLRGDAKAQARFEREVTHLARVRHENVVQIHEAGVDDGRPFFAMELVEGRPLDVVLRDGRPPLRLALGLAAGVCRGVDALHAIGVVHRDLKPQNVLITPEGRPVVVDVGLALAPELDDRLTKTGAMVGTIAYMAPEQLSGRPVSPATDVFALGLILFELVTGRAAIEEGSTAAELIASVMSHDRPAPGDLEPTLPAKLDAVCARATAREATARYARAGELADAIDDVLRAPGPPRSRRDARRRWTLGALTAVASTVVIALVVVAMARSGAPVVVDREDDPDASLVLVRAFQRELAALRDPVEVVTRADAWLAAYPAHPERARIEARRRDARRRLGDEALRPLRAWSDDERATPAYLSRVVAWLGEFPEHPEAGSLRAVARATSRRVPLATLDPAKYVAFVPGSDGRLALLAGRAGIALWDLERVTPVRRWDVKCDGLALTPDGVAALLRAGRCVLRLRLDGEQPEVLVDSRAPVWAIALSPDGETLAVGTEDGVVRLVAADTGALLRELPPQTTHAYAMTFTRRGHRLLIGNWGMLAEAKGPCLRVHDVDSGELLCDVPLVGSTTRFALSPDDRLVAVGTGMGRIFLFDVDDLERPPRVLIGVGREKDQATVAEPRACDGYVGGLVFSPDGRWLTATAFDGHDEDDAPEGELAMWDVTSGREVVSRALLRRPVDGFGLAAADDARGFGRRLLVAGGKSPSELWLWHEGPE